MTTLGVLDLVPVSSGSTAPQALRNSIDLARQAEGLGYNRYWFAEHHLNPGVAGTSPAVLLALTAAETSTIRLGSGADRVETQFVGTAIQVADQLERLRDATEADELIITTITHDHHDRVHSYRLLAEEWARR